MADAPGAPPASGPACDLLVFAAHPDDAELCCGGLLLVSAKQGRRTAVVDLTRGEMGSLGTPEIRAQEAAAAAKILGLSYRANLGLPDGHLRDTDENRNKIVRVVRQLRPRVIVAPPLDDHHPDHIAVHELVKRSFYLCGIRKYLPELPPHRPRSLLYHLSSRPTKPQLIVDVSDVIDERMQAVRAYESQFGSRQDKGFPVRIAAEKFVDSIQSSLMYFGSLIGVTYGEPYSSDVPLPVADPVGLFESEPWKDK